MVMNYWSRWIDKYYQMLKPFVPSNILSTSALLSHPRAISGLPSRARFWTADADTMYPNIETPHALHNIGGWIDELSSRPDFPENSPSKLSSQPWSL